MQQPEHLKVLERENLFTPSLLQGYTWHTVFCLVLQTLLCKPQTKLAIGGDRTFQKGAPSECNQLPLTIRSSVIILI